MNGLIIKVFMSLVSGGKFIDSYEEYDSYSHAISAVGGFDNASFTLKGNKDSVEDWVESGLGRHIVIYNENQEIVWEGFVNQISANVGPVSVSRGPLMDIANRTWVMYQEMDNTTTPPTAGIKTATATVNNTVSQEKYGVVAKILSGGQLDSSGTDAEQIRDTYLAEHAFPETTHTISDFQETAVTVSCLGYVYWLDATTYYYDDDSEIIPICDPNLSVFPQTLVLDDFDRADEDPLTVAHWTSVGGGYSDLQVTSNQCTSSAVTDGYEMYNTNFGLDCEVYCTIEVPPNDGGFVAISGRNDWAYYPIPCYSIYVLRDDVGGDELNIVAAGFPALLTVPIVLSAGDSLGARFIGDTIEVWYKLVGGSWSMMGSVVDTTYVSTTSKLILGMSDNTARVDNFGGGNLVDIYGKLPAILTNALTDNPWLADSLGTTLAENLTGVMAYEGDSPNGWDAIKELVAKGDGNNYRYLFGMYANRRFDYRAVVYNYKYQMQVSDVEIRVEDYVSHEHVRPWNIQPGYWMLLTDFLAGRIIPSNLRQDPRSVFLESVTYTAPYTLNITGGKVTTLEQKLNRMGLGGISS